MTTSISFDEPDFQQFFNYWDELRGDDLVPAKSNFDPRRVSSLLPKLSVLQWRPPDHLFLRLMGTGIVSQLRGERTGTNLLDIIQASQRDEVTKFTASLFSQVSIAIVDTQRHFASGKRVGLLFGFFPFRNDSDDVNFAVGVHRADLDADRLVAPNDNLIHAEVFGYEFIDIGSGIPDLVFGADGRG